MIPQENRQIKTHAVPEIAADRDEYRHLLDDMLRHSEKLLPEPNWLMTEDVSAPAESYDLERAFEYAQSDEAFAKISHFPNLMSAWVGGSQAPSEEEISKYRMFLRERDVLDLWDDNVERPRVPLGRQDLGSLMDLNLLYLYSFSTPPKDWAIRILEVGGGYGRLAEAAFNIFGPSIQYVMIDSVPASLYYARKYLSHTCPNARIGYYYDSPDSFNPAQYDISIIPAWHFERLNNLRYDLCVNIESMQEMNQFHVDYYLNLFDRLAVDGATIYISNAHDYYFKGSFNYPPNWERLFKSNTPRSNLCLDHPTEIFRKVGEPS